LKKYIKGIPQNFCPFVPFDPSTHVGQGMKQNWFCPFIGQTKDKTGKGGIQNELQ
jgi:hypothetical protein